MPEIAVFPVGAVEQHSLHLPLGTDWHIAKDLSKRVAEELGAFLVPPLPFSMSECHGPMAGTVWLKPDTLAAVLEDVVASLYGQGFRVVVVLNCHGGNFVLESEIRRLNALYPDLVLLMPPPFWGGSDEDPVGWDKGPDVHAEEAETSYQLYINPEYVRDERVDCEPVVGREFLDYAFAGFISEWGAWGCPSYGTAEKGEKHVANMVRLIVGWVRETLPGIRSLKGEV